MSHKTKRQRGEGGGPVGKSRSMRGKVIKPGANTQVKSHDTEADRKLLTEWFMAFTKEALGEDIGPQGAGRSLDAYLGTEGLYLWEDGQAVSIAGRSRPTPNGTTVNYVYTPPQHRNRGYASACVAALSQLLLDEGYRYCFLFTDLANPTSNKIYRAVGYEPVCDVDEYEFGQASGGRWAPRS
jgi:predicted GNAT family acetyltransferase